VAFFDTLEFVRFSINNSNDSAILMDTVVALYNTASVSLPFLLREGEYRLTKFEVLNKDSQPVLRTPLVGSSLGQLVKDPLPYTFDVTADSVHHAVIEVLKVEGHRPEDFGFAYLGFPIADILSIPITGYTMTRNGKEILGMDLTTTFENTSAVPQEIHQVVSPIEGAIFTVPDVASTTYNIVARAYGMEDDTLTMPRDSLKNFSDSGDTLEVELTASSILRNLAPEEELHFEVRGVYPTLDGRADKSNSIWFGSFNTLNVNSTSGTQIIFETEGETIGTTLLLVGDTLVLNTNDNSENLPDFKIPGILDSITYSFMLEFDFGRDSIRFWVDTLESPYLFTAAYSPTLSVSFPYNDLSGSDGAGFGVVNGSAQGRYSTSLFNGTLGKFTIYQNAVARLPEFPESIFSQTRPALSFVYNTVGDYSSLNGIADRASSVWFGSFNTLNANSTSGTQMVFETGGTGTALLLSGDTLVLNTSDNGQNLPDFKVSGIQANTTYSFIVEFDFTGDSVRCWLDTLDSPHLFQVGDTPVTSVEYTHSDLDGGNGAGFGVVNGNAQGRYPESLFNGTLGEFTVYYNTLVSPILSP
jgi:hypothetical protein